MIVDGEFGKANRALVSFDVSSIPPGATVTSASLTLCYRSNPSGGSEGRTHELRRVTSAWGELLTDWLTQPSVAAGVSASIVVPTSQQCMTFVVTSDLQGWVNNSFANNGWRLSDQDETNGSSSDAKYATSEESNVLERPSLTVAYYP